MSNDYVLTYTKTKVTPLSPRPEDIRIEDIAHALPRIARANGHFRDFYSVGQHCLDCAKEAISRGCSAREALGCLLHDAAEAYLADIMSPVKKMMPEYIAIEDRLLNVIYAKYIPDGLTVKEQRLVKEIDNTLLYYEFLHFMEERLKPTAPIMVNQPDFSFSSFAQMEQQYLTLFAQLSSKIQQETPYTGKRSIGIAYCQGSWLAVMIAPEDCSLRCFSTLEALCMHHQQADTILVNLPIGLPQTSAEADLRPDCLLRRDLKGQPHQRYTTPCRQAVYASDASAAQTINRQILHRPLSPQCLTLLAAIKEVDQFLQSHSDWKNVLRESYPETLAAQQYQLFLQTHGACITKVENQRYSFDGRQIQRHAIQSALALAIIGQLECRQKTRIIPEEPHKDAKGILMQIVLPKGSATARPFEKQSSV